MEPAPVSWFRGAVPHRLCSYALRQPFRAPLRSWRTIIGIAYEEASALHPWPHCARKPFIEDMMQEYISSYGRGYTALWDACLRVGQHAFFHDPSVEPFPNQPHDPSIIDPFTQYFS